MMGKAEHEGAPLPEVAARLLERCRGACSSSFDRDLSAAHAANVQQVCRYCISIYSCTMGCLSFLYSMSAVFLNCNTVMIATS